MNYKTKLSYRQWIFKPNLLLEKLIGLGIVFILTIWVDWFIYMIEGGIIVYKINKYGDYEGHIGAVYYLLVILYVMGFNWMLKDGYKDYCKDFDYWHEVYYGDKKLHEVRYE